MRLSELIRTHGVAKFSAEDFQFVGAKLTTDPERLVLVGGQAIEVWGVLLDAPSPSGDSQPLTEDADWLGGKRDAKWLCDLLGGPETVNLQLAKDFDPSLSSALAFIRRPNNRILMLDFMRTIAGPDAGEVRRLAVKVELFSGVTITVMHPLLCLESRFANLELIPRKRQGNGPIQALWAVQIVHKYLLRMLANGDSQDQLAKACRHIAEVAEYKHGPFCLVEFGLNALDAVPQQVVAAAGAGFSQVEWPRILARIQNKQKRWKALKQARANRASTTSQATPLHKHL